MDKSNTIKYPCENIKHINNNSLNCCQGSCINVPVTLHNVCENEHLLVIVEVYLNKKLYAREIRKIFTGYDKIKNNDNSCNYNYSYNDYFNTDYCNDHNKNNHKCDCPSNNHKCGCSSIETFKFHVGDFEFFFIDRVDPSCIHIQVKTQCLYDC